MSEIEGQPQSILFVCTLNSVRSPIAEAVAKSFLGRHVFIDSAGLRKSDRDMFAITVLREIGIDFSGDEPRLLETIGIEGFDLVITLSPEARIAVTERIRATAVQHVHWSIDDPTQSEGSREARLQAYRGVREKLRGLIKDRLVPRYRKGAHA